MHSSLLPMPRLLGNLLLKTKAKLSRGSDAKTPVCPRQIGGKDSGFAKSMKLHFWASRLAHLQCDAMSNTAHRVTSHHYGNMECVPA